MVVHGRLVGLPGEGDVQGGPVDEALDGELNLCQLVLQLVLVLKHGLYLALHGLYLALHGLYLALHGLYLALQGLYLALQGLQARGDLSRPRRRRTARSGEGCERRIGRVCCSQKGPPVH